MSDGEKITLSFDIDFGNSIQKFDSLTQAGEKLHQTIDGLQKTAKKALPDIGSTFNEASQTVDGTLEHMQSIQKELNSGTLDKYQTDIKTTEFANLSHNLSAIIADMQTLNKLSQTISKNATSFTKQRMESFMPQLMKMANNAVNTYKGSGVLASDSQIIAAIKSTDGYKQISSGLFGKNAFNENVMNDILKYAVLKTVPQIQRGSFMQHFGTGNGLTKHIFDSFQDMLPRAFQNINKGIKFSPGDLAKRRANDNSILTSQETSELYSMLMKNAYAANAAEAVGMIYRQNGRMNIRKNLTRGMVNAMGGNIYDEIVNAAKGMPMYGVTDVNDAASWDKIARKSNKRFMGGMSAARRLSDQFEWFDADRYSAADIKKLNQFSNSHGGNTYYDAGKIKFSPMQRSYEVARYTLDDILNGKNWNDGKSFDPEHHFAIDGSLHLDTIMRHNKQGIRGHNSYLNDVIYLDIDPRLADPNLDPNERSKIEAQYAKIFQHGISGQGKNEANERYVLSRINAKSGAEFVRKSQYDKILKEDPYYFSAGLKTSDFTDWKEFSSSMEYRNKNATPGQSIQKLFGSELPKNIVIVDLENTTKGDPNNPGAGVNGASIISNRLVQSGFQGRAHGIKSALSSVDIDALVDAYGGNLELTAFTRNKSEEGRKIKIDKGVDMIINAADLKNADKRFEGMSYDEIRAEVYKDLQKGIYANRLYSDANGKTRWLSGQLAQTFAMDKDSSMMFSRAFMDHYRDVGTYEGAMASVFANDDETRQLLDKHPELFGSTMIQNRIQDYRNAIMSRMLRGDIMLPKELNAYKGMASVWWIDAFNEDMKKNGSWNNLDEKTQERLNGLTLGDNRVLFQNTLATKLGLARYPATGRSAQSVNNAVTDEKITNFAKAIGLDPYGLYISPTAPLMQLLQDADFDGDVMEIIELATNDKKKASVASIMDKVFTATMKRNKELYKKGGLSDEQLDARTKLLQDTIYGKGSYSTNFATAKGARSASKWLSAAAQQAYQMGAPNAVVRNAFQMNPDSEVALALIDADKQYSTNSVEAKKGTHRRTSSEQMSILGKYKPFSEFYHMVDNARDQYGNVDYSQLKDKNFFAVNLPSAFMSGSMRSQMLSRFIAKNKFGYDVNPGYDWDKVFEAAHGDIDPSTAVGRMQLGLKDVIKGVLNADYLAPSDMTVAQLIQLKNLAMDEEIQRVAAQRNAGQLSLKEMKSSDKSIARRRLSTQGGNTIDNLIQYALTQDKAGIGINRDLFGQLNELGIGNLYGNVDLSQYVSGTPISYNDLKSEAEAQRLLKRDEQLRQLSTLDEEARKGKIDALKWSPSMISELIKDPIQWANRRLNGDWSDKVSTPYTEIGTAAHNAIEGFMKKRMEHKNGPMSSEELANAANEAVKEFEAYFGDRVDANGKLIKNPLTKTQMRQMKTEGNSLNTAYSNVIRYLQNDLVKLFPDSEYEVSGIEGELGFNLGKQLKTGDDITSKGLFDLLFKNRKTGKYTMMDMKNYLNPTIHDKAMWKMQQLLYASALPDYIKTTLGDQNGTLDGINIVNPIRGVMEAINSSPDAIKGNLDKVRTAVQMVQSLSETGFNTESFLKVSKAVDDLFGGKGFYAIGEELQKAEQAEQQRMENMTKQVSGDNGQAVGGALVMHDEYNKAMNALSGINSFIFKNDQDRQDYRGNRYAQQYQTLSMQDNVIRDLRNAGMDIQADRLQDESNRVQTNLDALLPKNAIGDLSTALELLQNINKEETVSKSANSRVEHFKQLSEQIKAASDAYEVLQDKYESNKDSISNKKAELKGEKDAEKRIQLQNEIDALQQQNKSFAPSLRSAKSLQSKLETENEKYLQKQQSEVWEELYGKRDALQSLASGKQPLKENSIADDVKAYMASIRQTKADAKLYAKELGISQDSQEYKDYIASLNTMLGLKNIANFRNQTIDNSLYGFEDNRGKIAGNIHGMELSTDEQIDEIVRKQTERIEQEKRRIAKRLNNTTLTANQRERLEKLNDYYSKYDEEAYRKQVTQERADKELLMRNRQSRQTDQMISQLDRIKMGRAGYYSNSIAGRAARQVQQELWQRRSVQDQYQTQLEQWQIEQKKYTDGNGNITNQEQYDNAAQHIGKLNAAIEQNKAAMSSLNGVGGTTAAVFGQIGQAVDGLLMRLGRQMFQKALAEAKRFIQEFDSSMNEIQAITLKSGTQMEPIRKQTISKAIGMRTSVSNVANTEAALYRQGLSDEEVSSRTDAIIKFATVTKLNVTEATKIITTALQNDLVASAEQAMDALVALGDSAATTAAEIGKGMQKAAASAKVAGVSYAELTSLLTLGTSDTQLSGTQVGTALQTVFTRMRRISMSGFAADQNGDKTTASDAEAALKTIGVDLYSDKGQGKMRGAYEILRDIAKVWEHLSDVQKSLVTNAMAGTRQTNIFSTLMEGMSENGGERMDEYLGLADGSQGITQSKYEIAMQSLSAAMNEFKSSFDSMVESLVNNGTITGVIDGLSGIFQWISGIASTDAGRIGVVFSAIAAGITAIGVAAATAKLGLGPVSTIIGLLVGLFAGGGLMWLTSLFSGSSEIDKAAAQREKDWQDVQDKKEVRDSAQTVRQDAIDNVRKLGKAYDELKDSQDKLAKSDAASKLTTGLYELKDAFPELSEEILNAIQKLSNWETAVDNADKKGQEYLKKNAEQYIADVYGNQIKNAQAEYEQELNDNTLTKEEIGDLRQTLKDKLEAELKADYGDALKDEDALKNFANGAHEDSITTAYKNLTEAREKYIATHIAAVKKSRDLSSGIEYDENIDSKIDAYEREKEEREDIKFKLKEQVEGGIPNFNSDIDKDIDALQAKIDSAKSENAKLVPENELPSLVVSALNALGSGQGVEIGDKEVAFLQNLRSEYTQKTDNFNAFTGYLSDDTFSVLESVFRQLDKGEDIANILDTGVFERIYTDLSKTKPIDTSVMEGELAKLKAQKKLQEEYVTAQDRYNELVGGDDKFEETGRALLSQKGKQDDFDTAMASIQQDVEDARRGYEGAHSSLAQSKNDENVRIKEALLHFYDTDANFKEFVDSRYRADPIALAMKKSKLNILDDNPEDAANFMRQVVGDINNPDIIDQFQNQREQISKAFAEKMVKQYANGLTTKQYGEEFMTTLLENMFKSEAYDDKGKIIKDFLNDKGDLDTEQVAKWVADKVNGYSGKTEDFVEANKENAVFPYYYTKTGQKPKGFMDYESARDWIITHGGTMTDLTDKDKKSIYQSAGSNINALIQKANEGNANIMLQNFLNGKEYEFTKEDGTKVKKRIKGLNEFHTIKELEAAYDQYGLNGEISTLLAQNPTMLGLYAMAKNAKKPEDQTAAYQRFKEAAKKMKVGQVSGSAIYDAVMEGLQTGSLNVTDLRTDGTYTDVYAAFKNFAGEAADEYLNALESGTMDGMDENIKKAVDRSVAANRIKEKMQFIPGYSTFSQNALTEMYGTDTERFSLRKQQVSSAADLDSYNAAVQRYRDHNVKEADFAIIAGRSMYSEAQLRNQYKSKAMDADLQREVDMYYADKVAEANNTIEAMRNGDADKDTIAASISNYMRQGYSFDIKTGRFTGYKPRSEEKETFASRRDSYNRQADESNLTPLWNALSGNEVWTDEGIMSFLNDAGYTDQDQINKLLEDSTFRNALNLDLDNKSTYLQNLAKRRATGKAGTFDENYGEWMKLIFGDDYNDKNKGITSGKFVISQKMKDKYNELIQNGKGAALDELFSAMAGGDIFREILAGGEGDINSAIQQYADQEYIDLFKNVKNGQQLAHDVTMFKTGTAVDQAQAAEQYMNTVQAQQQAQWALTAIKGNSAKNTAENRSMIASLLGLDDKYVKNMINKGKTGTDELQTMIDEKVKETQDSLLKLFAGFFDIDLRTADWTGIKNKLQGMSTGPIKDMLEAIIAAYDFTKGKANGSDGKDSLGDLFKKAKNGFADGRNTQNGFKALSQFIGKLKPGSKFEESLNTLENEAKNNKIDVDWSKFFTDNSGVAMMLDMYNNGKISQKQLGSFFNNGFFGSSKTNDYYNTIADTIFGDFFENGEFKTDNIKGLMGQINTLLNDNGSTGAAFDEWLQKFPKLQEVINQMNAKNLKGAVQALKELNDEMRTENANTARKYGDQANYVLSIISKLKKGGKDAASAVASLTNKFKGMQDIKTAASKAKGKSGKQLDKQTRELIASYFDDISADDIKSMTKEELQGLVDKIGPSINQDFNNIMQGLVSGLRINIPLRDIDVNGDGKIDLSELEAVCRETGNEVIADLLAMAGRYGTVQFDVKKDGKVVVLDAIVKTKNKYNKGGGGGGGGGNKKTAGDKLIEKQKQSNAINDHEIKMVQAQENYYEGRSELGYLNETINSEQTIRRRYGRRLEKQNKELHNQLKQTKRGSEEWYKLRDAIMANEEAQKENTNAIEENTRKIKENRSAIRKLRMDLEDTIKTEIETRIKEKRDMLEGRASMEKTILGIIQERYRKEWDLIKRDIDKKKEALEEEKKLIDERLQARKNAADKASKYEELAELQNQLAMISMDSTRTKDAADLRKRIADLQGDIAWGTAEDETNNQKEALDDRIQAYDEFEQRGDEALEKYLEDANNFAGEVNKVLKMSQKDLIKWLEKNDDEYKNSLNNTKKSIVEGWTDLYKQMKGITDTYWKEINKILGSKRSYIDYMKGSSEYKNASKTEKLEMEYQWGLQYDNYTAALKTGSKYSHSDDWANDEGKKDDKKGRSGSGGSGKWVVRGNRYEYANGKKGNSLDPLNKLFTTKEDAEAWAKAWSNRASGKIKYGKLTASKYALGGLVDYTGPAWVDGTPTKPEAFLSAVDTKNIRDLLDAFNYIKSPRMTYYDTMKNMGNTNNSIGEVSVTINGATFEDDADYEKIAQRVGEEFAKELQRQGFSTARYNF